jgi:uroporphyrin-III C-methyltransferase
MGKVYIVGAGPGDPELLTVKATRLLERATVVLHDSLVSREVLARIPSSAEIVDVGKRAGQKLLTQDEINSLLVSYAKHHEVVIRLKGGDPTLFGRAGEEIEALREAHVPFEIVPGITAALGAAAAAEISLTDRRAASQLVITTYSRGEEAASADPFAVTPSLNWAAISSNTTLVLYMPGADYSEVSRRLLSAGQPEDLPCVIVSNATRPNQQVRHTTVSGLASESKLPAPALLIVGRVGAHDLNVIASRLPTSPTATRVSDFRSLKSRGN